MLSVSLLSSYPNLMMVVVIMVMIMVMIVVVLFSAVCPSKLEEPLEHMDYEFS